MGGPKPHRILLNFVRGGKKIYRVLMGKPLGILGHCEDNIKKT